MSSVSGINGYDSVWASYNKLYQENNAFSDLANQITMAFQYNGGPDTQSMANTIRSVASTIRKEESWKGDVSDTCCRVMDQLATVVDREYEQYCSWVRQVIQYYTETMRQQAKELEEICQQFNEADKLIYQERLAAGRYTLGGK